jgi:hypothetical protein
MGLLATLDCRTGDRGDVGSVVVAE